MTAPWSSSLPPIAYLGPTGTATSQPPPDLPTAATNTDPLINSRGEAFVYLGAAVLLMLVLLVIGRLWGRLSQAIAFALALALVLIWLIWLA